MSVTKEKKRGQLKLKRMRYSLDSAKEGARANSLQSRCLSSEYHIHALNTSLRRSFRTVITHEQAALFPFRFVSALLRSLFTLSLVPLGTDSRPVVQTVRVFCFAGIPLR